MKDSQLSNLQPYQTPQSSLEQFKSKTEEEYGEFKLFSLEGRVGRIRYLAYSTGIAGLAIAIAGIVVLLTNFLVSNTEVNRAIMMFTVGIAVIVMLVNSFFLMIQRLHDFNLSGWFLLLSLVPIINSIFGLLVLAIPGTRGTNQFGPPGPPNKPTETILGLGLPVLAVVGIVAAVAVPAYQVFQQRVKVSEAIQLLNVLKTPTEEYLLVYHKFPPQVEVLGGKTAGKYTAQILSNPKEFYFEATMKPDETTIAGKAIRLIFDPQSNQWSCSVDFPNGIDQKYVPSVCKKP